MTDTPTILARRENADSLLLEGRLDEALTILSDEILPHFIDIGDARETTITQGRIADVLFAQGKLEEAMALQAERLPVVSELGDDEGIAHVLFSMANIRLARGEHESGNLQQIYEELAEAFQLSCRHGQPDAIGGIGMLLVQVLAMGGLRDDAMDTLNVVEEAFTALGDVDSLARVRELRGMLEG